MSQNGFLKQIKGVVKINVKTDERTIQKIRDMRAKLNPVGIIAKACGVSTYVVQEYTKDMGICLRKQRFVSMPMQVKDLHECKRMRFEDLPEELQKKYLLLKPPRREDDKETFITAHKGDYGKAAVFEDYRAAHGM